jgi:hypothetical protein
MLSTGLAVSSLVSVQVSLTTPAITAPAINSLMILGSSNVIGAGERMREYTSITEVGGDFLNTSPEWQAADMWFAQAPSPQNVFIGRWFQTAGAGQLTCGPLTAAEQQLSNWTTITDGGFNVTIGGTLMLVVGLNFAGVGNMNAVAAIIAANTLLAGVAGATVTWSASDQAFIFQTKTTGATATITVLSAPTGTGTPTDISALLGGTAAEGAVVAQGVTTESALTALTIIDGLFSTQFYGVVCPQGADSDHLALAGYCEAADPPHYYGVTTAEPLTLNATDTTSLASQLAAFGYNKTAVQFSTTNPYAIASYLARILTTQWGGSNTTIDLMYKREPGVAPEQLSATQAATLAGKNCNVYAAYATGATMIQHGVSCSGVYTDTIIGADALAGDVQAALFNVMYTAVTKVPQTDVGMSMLFAAATAVCNQYSVNDYLNTGIWTAQGFGTLNAGDLLPLGFYIYSPSILVQSSADRAARKAPIIMIAAKTAGAIESADVAIFVNQ